jgi:hypothetical protein
VGGEQKQYFALHHRRKIRIPVARLAAMVDNAPEIDVRSTDELARLREENLRLRDLLIARDAELGSLKGQVAALEAGTARLLNLVGRIQSLVPSILLGGLTKLLRRIR